MSGTVVDPDGKPLAGVWIEPGGSYANRSQFTKTDDAGRFTVRDLPTGMVPLGFHYGKLMAQGKYLALRDADPLTIKLGPVPDAAQFQARSEAAKAARDRPQAARTRDPRAGMGVGSLVRRPVPQARRLPRQGRRPQLLGHLVRPLRPANSPSLEKLRARYEPLGVVFLTLHTPGETEKTVRKVLEMKKSSLVFAFDGARKNDEFDLNGMTAERYGVGGYPTSLIIDREGKIAFRSNDPSNMPAMQRAVKDMGLDPKTINEEQASHLIERLLEGNWCRFR